MMRKTSLLFTFSLTVLLSFTQEVSDNFTIGILPVTATNNSAKAYCALVQDAVTNVFSGKKRFTLVDRTKFDQIAQERNLQKSEDFLDGQVTEQGKSLGAQYLIQGNISQLSTQSVQIAKTRTVGSYPNQTTQTYYVPGYNVTFALVLQTVDVATGQIKSAKTISTTKRYETTNADQAIGSALQSSLDNYRGDSPLKQWADKTFPVAMKILKVEESDKKGRPKMVLIKGGEDMGLHRGKMGGSILQVYINDKMEVDGKVFDRQLPVGEIMVDENQGEFTICKVKDGAEEILKHMNEGKTLFLKMTKW